jgi:hypothetical protein
MSQIEQRMQAVLNRRPEIERCVHEGLLNRRALARFLISAGVAGPSEFDAVLATIRRHDFGEGESPARELFSEIRMSLKDQILVLDFAKDRALFRKLERLIAEIDYDRGETFKVVVGTATIKLFVDVLNEPRIARVCAPHRPLTRSEPFSEVSLVFPEAARSTPNILSVVARELSLRGVLVAELLTASPELLIYLHERDVPKAIDAVRELQRFSPPPDRARRASRVRSRSLGG